MQGREFLSPARTLIGRTSEADWRGAAIHAYYALFLECRDLLARWGRLPPGRHNVHPNVRLKFLYARAADLHQIGRTLDDLIVLRNSASYDLRVLARFASPQDAKDAIQKVDDALVLLDAIEADPARRAAAIAALPP
jgi:hypothetical protein